jgi:branched-chain amino acid aminotransferase
VTARAWVNGRVVDADAPALLTSDHGLTVGDGVFETCKILRGRPFAMTRHLDRLAASATGLDLPEPDLERIRAGVDELLAAQDPIEFGRLRITVTGGTGPLGSERAAGTGTCVLQTAVQAPPPPTGAVVLAPWVRNERSAVAGIKTTSYAENVVALAYAKARGAAEALLGNTLGNLCEGTGSNVFVAVDGELVTPPLSAGPLSGISRALLLEWGTDAGLPIREADLPVTVLDDAPEVVLTSSIRDVQPAHAVDGRALGEPGEFGPLGAMAVAVFAERAAQDVDP